MSASVSPKRGMVLAAGLGLRMRPLTDRLPKPLVAVAGRSLLDRALDHLAAAGVETAVVNTHHLAEQIARHLAARRRPRIVLSHEPELLETGGGVVKALADLAPDGSTAPFYVVNGDALWLDGSSDTLGRLAAAWNAERMDALLLLQAVERAVGYGGAGDFRRRADGTLERRGEGGTAPHLFTGVQLLAPALFAGCAAERFSLNRLYDRALAAGRLHGLVHDGPFFHVGTPEGVALAERGLAALAAPARG